MLYAFLGSDSDKRQEKVSALVAALLAKKPDASLEQFDDETFDMAQLPALIKGQGLFSSAKLTVLSGVLARDDVKDEVVASLKDLKASENIIVISERSVDAKTRKKLNDFAEKVLVFEGKEKQKVQINPFAITEALAKRDKKNLWLLFSKERERGAAMEELHGRLFWQMKSMLLAAQTNSAVEAGLKPFVYQKAKAAGAHFTLEEMKLVTQELVYLYHRAHRGEIDFAIGLEKWVLRV